MVRKVIDASSPGHDWDVLDRYFNEAIDDFRIYNNVQFSRDNVKEVSLSELEKYYNNIHLIRYCPKCMCIELEKYIGISTTTKVNYFEPSVRCVNCNHKFIIYLE